MQKTFLTNSELCVVLRCSLTTLWRLRRDIPNFPEPCRLGRRLLWSRDQVDQVIGLIR